MSERRSRTLVPNLMRNRASKETLEQDTVLLQRLWIEVRPTDAEQALMALAIELWKVKGKPTFCDVLEGRVVKEDDEWVRVHPDKQVRCREKLHSIASLLARGVRLEPETLEDAA